MTKTSKHLFLLVTLLAIDQLTKWWIERPDFHAFPVIDGFLNVVRAHNTGVAFSLFTDLPSTWGPWFILGLTWGIALVVALWWWRERRHAGPTPWLLTLILAGAIGNIIDRMMRGYVVDFIDCYVRIGGEAYHWPAFNVADSCISIGIVGLFYLSIRHR